MAKHRNHPTTARLRGRLWVEIGNTVALTEAGADLLEQIEALGSLSEAARRLGFSYRRAWILLDGLNRSWPRPLADTKVGGHHGGGATLTEAGRAVLAAYRALQVQLEHLLACWTTPPQPFTKPHRPRDFTSPPTNGRCPNHAHWDPKYHSRGAVF